MNEILLQDSGRSGKSLWTIESLAREVVGGIILSPFATPRIPQPRRPSAQEVTNAVSGAGGEVLLDPLTHAVLLPTTDSWRIYDTWALWDGARGDLSTYALRAGHVLRVLEAQVGLGLPPLAPTLRLESSLGAEAERSLDLASLARSQGDGVWLAIAGSDSFWAQGSRLDDYVGQIAQLRPAGVSLSVFRSSILYPARALADEVSGLCRSVHSLSLRCRVVVQYADMFGLPALSAGADAIGTGWDLRQRVLAPDAFRDDTTTRRTAHRITHQGIFGVLKRPEAERLARLEPALSARLVPGNLPPNGNALWEHHLTVMSSRAGAIKARTDRETSARFLAAEYGAAMTDFTRVEGRAGPLEFGPASWLAAVTEGLARYIAGEGW